MQMCQPHRNHRRMPYQHIDDERPLPKDPRTWSRDDVRRWLAVIASTHGLHDVHAHRFRMNGKALCLMTRAMFVRRVPGAGGDLLHADFQLRLCAALMTS